jgi:hypothetical protein
MVSPSPLALLAAAALTAGAVVVTAPSADAAPAKAPVGAGYVASPARISSASMIVRVPTLACGPRSTTSVQVGMFGSLDQRMDGSDTLRHWSLVVVAACRNGSPRYRAEQGGGDPEEALGVRAGDRVKLIQQGADEYEIDDLTRGGGVGGGSAGGPGEKDTLIAPVLFGGRVSGSVRRATHVAVLQSHLDRTALTKVKPTRQRQVRGGSDIATATGLRSPGAFAVTVVAQN